MKLTRKETAEILRKRHAKKVSAARGPRIQSRGFAEKEARGRLVDRIYRAWVRRLPCIAGLVKGGCSGPIEAAHLRFSDFAAGRANPGMQRKSDDTWCLPLCRHHHQSDQHKRSERGFWADLGIDPNALAKALHDAFGRDHDGLSVIRQFTRKDAA